jgi:phage terminase large subunit-like protein
MYDGLIAEQPRLFAEKYCTFTSGSRCGQPFLFAPWQQDVASALFGTISDGRERQYKVAWLEAPRKSGKTTLAAVLMLYMLLVDEEAGAEIVISSSSTRNAAVCFNIARAMVENNADMSAVCDVRSKAIIYKDNSIRLIPGTAATFSGANPSMVVIDDIQTIPQENVHEQVVCSVAGRASPVILYLAAAGRDSRSPAWELHKYARGVMSGSVRDPTWLARIYGAETTADWTDPRVWKKAHPGVGLTISESTLREECIRALNAPGNVEAFRRSFLNVWTGNDSPWLDMDKWDRCQRKIEWGQYEGRPCRIGLDLSATTDLTAVVVILPEADGDYAVLPIAFCPEGALDRGSRRDGVNYRDWAERGFLMPTAGNTVDYAAVHSTIHALCGRYSVIEVLYDEWAASMLVGSLLERGIACIPVRQDGSRMSAAVRVLERLVENGKVRHDGNPVLRWCVSNTLVTANAAGMSKPTKRRSRDRIDLTVATLLALSGYDGGSVADAPA